MSGWSACFWGPSTRKSGGHGEAHRIFHRLYNCNCQRGSGLPLRFMSASGYYGLATGVGLCCVAFVGCHGPAWIAKVKRDIGWPAALFGMLATAACFGVTLYGGLGTIASGGADLRAKTSKSTSDIERNRATLQRLTAQRTDLNLSPHLPRR